MYFRTTQAVVNFDVTKTEPRARIVRRTLAKGGFVVSSAKVVDDCHHIIQAETSMKSFVSYRTFRTPPTDADQRWCGCPTEANQGWSD